MTPSTLTRSIAHPGRPAASLVVGLLMVPLGAGLWIAAERASRRPLNLLVITLDTTRADHLGAYGFPRGTTPAIDALAREGAVFEAAVSPIPFTLPAHCSLFTGLYPPTHQVHENGTRGLGTDVPVLAELLQRHGYDTGAFVGSSVLDAKWGLNRGFSTYDEVSAGEPKPPGRRPLVRSGREVMDRAVAWLDHPRQAPFFAWIHLYDAHAPYDPPEPYARWFQEDPYSGSLAFMDAQVGRVLTLLRARGQLDRTLMVITADHGESLGEHGEQTHGFFIYESTLHVPLIIRAPIAGAQGRRIQAVTRSVDVLPTVLDLLAMPALPDLPGTSLRPLLSGRVSTLGLEAYAETLLPRDHFGWSDLHALRVGHWKFIAAPRPELYDLAADPGEAHNVYDAHQDIATRMAADLARLRLSLNARTDAGDRSMRPDAETLAGLAALGYVSGGPPAAGPTLADPKDEIGLYNQITAHRAPPRADR